jgi:hypothetical protein
MTRSRLLVAVQVKGNCVLLVSYAVNFADYVSRFLRFTIGLNIVVIKVQKGDSVCCQCAVWLCVGNVIFVTVSASVTFRRSAVFR